MSQFRQSLLSAGAALVLAGSVLLAAPAFAEDAPPAPMPMHHQGMKHHAMKQSPDIVEARIAKLHDQLKITTAQEDKFNALAQVMRDNRAAHDALVDQKIQAEKTQSALDDLQAYAQIAQAHADGVKKLADAFGALYATLSPDQQKAADEAFRAHKQHVMAHMHKATKAEPSNAGSMVGKQPGTMR